MSEKSRSRFLSLIFMYFWCIMEKHSFEEHFHLAPCITPTICKFSTLQMKLILFRVNACLYIHCR